MLPFYTDGCAHNADARLIAMWGFSRSWTADRSSEPPEANSSWQSHGKGSGVSRSCVYLSPDSLPHHLLANEGWCDGGRWPHTTRGEGLSMRLCSFTAREGFILSTYYAFPFCYRRPYSESLPKM